MTVTGREGGTHTHTGRKITVAGFKDQFRLANQVHVLEIKSINYAYMAPEWLCSNIFFLLAADCTGLMG